MEVSLVKSSKQGRKIKEYFFTTFFFASRGLQNVWYITPLCCFEYVLQNSSTENYICKMKSIWCSKWPEKLFHQIFIMSQAVML